MNVVVINIHCMQLMPRTYVSHIIVGQVRRLHPTVVLSVKTHQASRSVLNYQKEIVNKLHNLGLIEQVDQETLLEV